MHFQKLYKHESDTYTVHAYDKNLWIPNSFISFDTNVFKHMTVYTFYQMLHKQIKII